MKQYVAVLTVIVISAACVSPEDRLAEYRAQCRAYGFAPKTDAMAKCVMEVDLARDKEKNAAMRNRQVIKAIKPKPTISVIRNGRCVQGCD